MKSFRSSAARYERIPGLAGTASAARARHAVDRHDWFAKRQIGRARWCDVNFEKLTIDVLRSVVDQRVGKVKREVSKKPVPIDAYVAEDLLHWRRKSKYASPGDYVFATDAARAGSKRGKQPLWLTKGDAVSHPTSRSEGWDRKTDRLAYLSAHLYHPAARQWRGRKSCARTLATRSARSRWTPISRSSARQSARVVACLRARENGLPGAVVSPKCPRSGIDEWR